MTAPVGVDAYPSFGERPHTLPHLLAWQAAVAPDGPALTAADGRLTFNEWARRAAWAARLLTDRGVGRGSLVGIWGGNSYGCAWAVAMLGIQWLGAVPVPMNSRMGAIGVGERLAELGAQHLVLPAGHAGDEALDALTRVAFEELTGALAGALPAPACRESDAVGIYHTSGTTGKPKPIVLSHAATAFIGAATEDHMLGAPVGIEPLGRGDVLQTSVSLHTTSGLMHMLAVLLFSGVHLVCETRFDPRTTVATMVAEGTTIWFAVPAMMILLCDAFPEAVARTRLRVIWHSGSVVTGSTLDAARQTFPGATAINIYSLTESGAAFTVSSARDAIEAPGTVGRPLPTTRLRVITTSGDPAAPNERGEVLFSSPYMLDGIYDRGNLAIPPELQDGWLRTGDGGYLDQDGRLWLTGRLGDVIIRGGYNIHPAAVERVIMDYPGVAEAAVVAVPHRVLGHDAVAAIVARGRVDVPALQDHCRRRLADYEVPRRVLFVDDLPRGDFGKVDRRRLRAVAEQAAEEAQPR